MTTKRTPEQIDRAFALADCFCFEIVSETGVPCDTDDEDRRSPVDAEQHEVASIASAAPGFRLAVEWLVERGLATVGKDAAGEFVVLARIEAEREDAAA